MRLVSALAAAAALMAELATAGSLSYDYSAGAFNYATDKPGAKNWIGVYTSYYGGPENGTYVSDSLTYVYATGKAASVSIDLSKLAAGHYKAFFLENDGYSSLADPVELSTVTAPVSFLVSDFNTANARQGSAFRVAVSGLVNNAGDSRNSFSLASGPSWAQVSGDGVVTGTPSAKSGAVTITVSVTAANGSKASINLKVPAVLAKGTPLVSTFKIMSFNLWYGGTQVRNYHQKQLNFLNNQNVDAVGIQESRNGHSIRIAKALGWYYWQSVDVGIISRYPIAEIYPEVEAGGSVRIALDGTDRQIIHWNAHLGYTPYGPYDFCFDNMTVSQVMDREAESGRTRQIKEIVGKMQFANSRNVPIFLTGDFNAPSHLDWTEDNKAAHCNVGYVPWPSSVEPVKAGLVDSFRAVYPDPKKTPAITWSPIYLTSDNGQPEPLDRIDFVYYQGDKIKIVDTQTLLVGTPKAEPNHADNEWTSDHKAMLTTFKWI